MGHMANEEYLHKENIDEYLEALARKIMIFRMIG